MEYEKFFARIRKDGDSLVITIPKNYIQYGGYKTGDEIAVMIKKKVE